MAKKLEIQLVKSVICTPRWQRTVVQTLGLRKINGKVLHPDTPVTWGQIKQIPHLLSVKVVEG